MKTSLILTIVVDCQFDRLEVSVFGVGRGRGRRVCIIDHATVRIDRSVTDTYRELDAFLLRTTAKANGAQLELH
jgi:phage terminase large subunit GpA-like protein